ncbi:unnamed protein product [Ascophyllum nodosum]
MESTARFRLCHNRGPAAVEERRQAYRRAASSGRTRRRRSRRGLGRSRLFFGPFPLRRSLLLLLAVACGTGITVNLRLFSWASWGSPKAGKASRPESRVSLGPDAIPSVVVYERSPSSEDPDPLGPTRSGGARRGLGLKGCSNTVQGVSLLADSEGRVCQRRNQDPQRPGCCATGRSLAGDGEGLELPKVDQGLRRSQQALVSARSEPITQGFPPIEAFSRAFSCWSCDVGEGGSSCCRSYEFCVSCCQDPSRAEEREAIKVSAARSGHPAYVDFGAGGVAGHPPRPLPYSPGEGESEAQLRAFDLCAFRCRTYSGSVAHENSYRSPLKHCFGRFRPPLALGMSGSQGGIAPSGERRAPPLQLDPFLFEFEAN